MSKLGAGSGTTFLLPNSPISWMDLGSAFIRDEFLNGYKRYKNQSNANKIFVIFQNQCKLIKLT